MESALYSFQDSIGRASWWFFGRQAALPDSSRFETCLTEPAITARVAEDVRLAATLKLTRTPTVVVNGRLYEGLPRFETLDSAVAVALAARRR